MYVHSHFQVQHARNIFDTNSQLPARLPDFLFEEKAVMLMSYSFSHVGT